MRPSPRKGPDGFNPPASCASRPEVTKMNTMLKKLNQALGVMFDLGRIAGTDFADVARLVEIVVTVACGQAKTSAGAIRL